MPLRIFLFICSMIFSFAVKAEAGGVVQRQEKIKAQRRAYQQALAQKAVQERQQALYQQTVQQNIQQQKQIVYQQALQQQAFRQQQLAYQQALRQGVPMSQLEPVGMHGSGAGSIPFQNQNSPQETVNLSHIFKELEYTSEMWPLILETSPKETIIRQYIEWYREQGITIRKDPGYYVLLIDAAIIKDSHLLEQPFRNLLKLMAVLEYDFDYGQDKDMYAQQFLGPQLYEENKNRLGLP